ncbi:MAG: hypothetical protein KIT84_08335 [Labilithrix sp.]|nr:hypothetical protein [Labilithrix sp.]MCW5811005.1 hypothetical protein [Labilithrix sp.]
MKSLLMTAGLALAVSTLGCGVEADEIPDEPEVATIDGVGIKACKDLVKTYDAENATMGDVYTNDCLRGAGGSLPPTNTTGGSFGGESNVPYGTMPLGPDTKRFSSCVNQCMSVEAACMLRCSTNPGSTGSLTIGKTVTVGGKTYGSSTTVATYTSGISGTNALGMCNSQCVIATSTCTAGCATF